MKPETKSEAIRNQRIFALVMGIPAFWIFLLLVLVLTVALTGCVPKPEYYPQYCIAENTNVWHTPSSNSGTTDTLPAGKQVFPTLEQANIYVKIEYLSDGFWISGYVPRARIMPCNR